MRHNKNNKDNQEEIVRVRVPRKQNGEVLAIVESMLGANRIRVRCMDGVTRMARIPGKMKKRSWIREDDVVIVIPWSFQDAKADVIWRYTGPQVSWLQRRGYLQE
ncbi:MAG: translation initiation factor eIF-1A [Methanosarcinales archaeon Met12]|nr:MAG: translation initiation factor eIF-1A [Methanosarcinales archaeon Met12]